MDVKKFGEFTQPGHAVTGDRTRRSRRIGWEYCHSIVDDCSRLAYSELHDDERGNTVTAYTERALNWFLELCIVTERLMTDNALHQESHAARTAAPPERSITSGRGHTRRTNGKVERYRQPLQREWAYAME